jgi:SAM-dependent methyltransferase
VDEVLYRLHAEREETYWWWVGKNRIILSLVDRFAPSHPTSDIAHPTSAALDIGCGAGGVLAKLAAPPRSFAALGIDMSPIAREYCAARGLTALDGSLPSALPPQIAPNSYDVIVMSEVIEHVPEDRASVHAVARLLKPGGLLVCTVPAHMWLWSSHDDFNFHQRRYTRARFGSLFEQIPGVTLERLVLSYYQAASLPLVVAGRLVEKLKTKLSGKPPPEPEVKPLPGPINWALTKAFAFERFLLPHTRLPWGTSVISVHRRVS